MGVHLLLDKLQFHFLAHNLCFISIVNQCFHCGGHVIKIHTQRVHGAVAVVRHLYIIIFLFHLIHTNYQVFNKRGAFKRYNISHRQKHYT